jgi:hypothetical protein
VTYQVGKCNHVIQAVNKNTFIYSTNNFSTSFICFFSQKEKRAFKCYSFIDHNCLNSLPSTHIYNKTLIKATDLRNFHITSMWFKQTTFDVIFLFVILIKPNTFTYSAPRFVVSNYYINQFSWVEIYSKPYYTMTIFIRSHVLGNPIMTNMKETPLPFRKITDY